MFANFRCCTPTNHQTSIFYLHIYFSPHLATEKSNWPRLTKTKQTNFTPQTHLVLKIHTHFPHQTTGNRYESVWWDLGHEINEIKNKVQGICATLSIFFFLRAKAKGNRSWTTFAILRCQGVVQVVNKKIKSMTLGRHVGVFLINNVDGCSVLLGFYFELRY